MNKNQFFKPTVLYKEYMILDMIEKDSRVTQREISKEIGIALSMVNDHLDQFEKERLVKRVKHSTKHVEYLITKKGIERRKVLNIGYLNASQHLYNSAKENVEQFLFQMERKGFANIMLYGAGEVCEILLSTMGSNPNLKLICSAVVDDDPSKWGSNVFGVKIIDKSEIFKNEHDAILISSFTNKDLIKTKLLEIDYKSERIMNFFD